MCVLGGGGGGTLGLVMLWVVKEPLMCRVIFSFVPFLHNCFKKKKKKSYRRIVLNIPLLTWYVLSVIMMGCYDSFL